ncbi:adenosylcobinamide-phosphate synthase CbiB [Rhodobacter sp. 24-YEA-8]|uniref:adenosylcobinamide-phosphate synthase CbiB n=1 Tax=Rhodobacter sp. 24-YEA-8 TaxID=1884310 RepID=UPI000899761B|nr:adenosylcobinamide-phosphate synthase CbiB [Rhodobacter sp. 24-YEA-8]SEB38628.1 adenosylcobinamide-phosphate synthase [Rhodobacter sp. 24-YEA-8]
MVLVLAMILDATFGEPAWIWRHLPHPAVLMGRLIGLADRRFNEGTARRLKGALVMAALVLGAGLAGWLIGRLPYHGAIETVIAAILIAQRSLVDHVRAVADGLRRSLDEGKRAVAMIVGRDTSDMREPDVARAAIESAAENLSDGVIAPVFWFLIAGLPGILIYKITNTADSMIGHMTPRHREFGWAAARFDDLLNLIPARLTSLLLALSHGWLDPRPVLRDAPQHRSPNAGWPESTLAPILNVALSGPRSYNGEMRWYPWVWPEGRRDAGPEDIDAACRALWRAWGLMLAIALMAALV